MVWKKQRQGRQGERSLKKGKIWGGGKGSGGGGKGTLKAKEEPEKSKGRENPQKMKNGL